MSSPTMISCPRCGNATPSANRFCGSCGSPVTLDVSNPTISTGEARGDRDRLSDSGAIQLRQLLVDATRGDFEVMEELGRGGMAIVYKAQDVHLSRPVAIKVLPPDLTYAKGTTERFQREAKTAAALDHPNIIPIYRISSAGRLFWYAMKYLEGRSLAEVLTEKGLLTVSETIAILEQVADALDYAHQRGVVHRDVKPGNVMLDVNGRVTVTDFGIAKELTSGGLTGSGAILGTPYYMSPEQCRGGANLTGAADQYSLAVMAYQMISGQLPFEADSAIDVIHKHVAEPPPPLENLLPGLPKHVINAINRGMGKKAEERFPTVHAFVNALKNVAAEATLMMERKASPLVARERSSRASRSSTTAVRVSLPAMAGRIAAGVVLIGGLVATVLWLNNRARDAETGGPTTAAAQPVTPGQRPAQPAQSEPPRTESRAPSPQNAPSNRPVATVRQPAGAPVNQAATSPAPATDAASSAGRKGFVRVNITNGYATFTLADKVVDQRRVFADSVAPGTYTVAFTRDGWVTENRTITVRAGQETAVSITMKQRSQP